MTAIRTRHVVPIAKAAPARQLVYGVVLEPDVPDVRGSVVTADEIEEAAQGFMIAYSKGRAELGVDFMDVNRERLTIVESQVAHVAFRLGDQRVRKGSWVLVTKVLDPALWEAVQAGLSIEGTGQRVPATEEEATMFGFGKRKVTKDLAPDVTAADIAALSPQQIEQFMARLSPLEIQQMMAIFERALRDPTLTPAERGRLQTGLTAVRARDPRGPGAGTLKSLVAKAVRNQLGREPLNKSEEARVKQGLYQANRGLLAAVLAEERAERA